MDVSYSPRSFHRIDKVCGTVATFNVLGMGVPSRVPHRLQREKKSRKSPEQLIIHYLTKWTVIVENVKRCCSG